MKTKPKLRARRMWANYYPSRVWVHPSRSAALQHASAAEFYRAVPVAVIPLRNVPAIIYEAMVAFQSEPSGGFEPAMRAALTAIGVLPKSKGGRK